MKSSSSGSPSPAPGRRLRQAWLVARALAFAGCAPLLWRMPLPALAAWLERRIASAPLTGGPDQAAETLRCVTQALDWAAPAGRGRCLVRGLTYYYFLRRAGMDVRLCFGAGWQGDRFRGHCWLIKEGAPFLEGSDPSLAYTPMFSWPAPESPTHPPCQ